jgi:hypothetical protein
VIARATWPASRAVDDFAIVTPVALRRRGVETRLVINSSDSQSVPRQPDAAMIKVAAQARRWWDDIVAQRFPTIRALARAYGKDERYVARLLPLVFLAPSIVEAILAGRQPVDLTAQDLVRCKTCRSNGTLNNRRSDLRRLVHLADLRVNSRGNNVIKNRSSGRHRIITQPDHAIGYERIRASYVCRRESH